MNQMENSQTVSPNANAVVYSNFRWFVLVAMIFSIAGQGMLLISPTPLVGEIAKTLHIQVGAATGASMVPFNLAAAVFGLLGGIIMDKLGTAKTFLGCAVVAAVSAFLIPMMAVSVPGLIAVRLISGMASGPMIASGARVAAEYFPRRQRAMYQGFVGASLSLGIMLGFGVVPRIAVEEGWQKGLSTPGFMMVGAAIFAIIMILGPKTQGCLNEDRLDGKLDKGVFKEVFKIPAFWFCFVSTFILSWVMNGFNDITPGHIAVDQPLGLGLGPVDAGHMMTFLQFSFLIGSIASGIIVEKVFGGKVRRMIPIAYIMVAIFASLSILPEVGANSKLLTACLILTGFFMGMPDPLNQAFIATSYPEKITGRVGGFTMGLSIFGGTLGVALGAMLVGITSRYYASITIVAVLCFIGAVCGSRMIPPKQYEDSTC